MSRIGNTPISIPQGVTVSVAGGEAVINGPKGQLKAAVPAGIDVKIGDSEISVSRKNNDRQTRAYHGLVRSLISNQIIGVTEGYKKTLKLVGTGCRAQNKGAGLSLALGFSHPVEIDPTEGVKFTLEGTDTIHVEGIDKQAVGQVAANIRRVRPPEPYKGKGIRYEDELVRTKPGKTAA